MDSNGNENYYASIGKAIELNIGCPNTHTSGLTEADIRSFTLRLIIKLPPFDYVIPLIERFAMAGVRTFHLSNTYPTRRGGLSGHLLKKINQRLIKKVRLYFGDTIQIIAGGGIYTVGDTLEYLSLGAKAVSLGTICYYPYRVYKVLSTLPAYLDELFQV